MHSWLRKWAKNSRNWLKYVFYLCLIHLKAKLFECVGIFQIWSFLLQQCLLFDTAHTETLLWCLTPDFNILMRVFKFFFVHKFSRYCYPLLQIYATDSRSIYDLAVASVCQIWLLGLNFYRQVRLRNETGYLHTFDLVDHRIVNSIDWDIWKTNFLAIKRSLLTTLACLVLTSHINKFLLHVWLGLICAQRRLFTAAVRNFALLMQYLIVDPAD